jgi:hypothetical protein
VAEVRNTDTLAGRSTTWILCRVRAERSVDVSSLIIVIMMRPSLLTPIRIRDTTPIPTRLGRREAIPPIGIRMPTMIGFTPHHSAEHTDQQENYEESFEICRHTALLARRLRTLFIQTLCRREGCAPRRSISRSHNATNRDLYRDYNGAGAR